MLELEPGSRISENELAQELGVSRTPVREALIELSKSKIVEIFPQKGSFISLIDWKLVDEAKFMRVTLECAVIRLACGGVSAAAVENLEKNVRLQQFYLENNDLKELLELDNAFHRELFRMTDKPHIYRLMDNMILHFDRVRTLRSKAIDQHYVIRDHMSILEAIRAADPDAGEKAMLSHLTRHEIDEAMLREHYPQYFTLREE